MSSQQTQDPPIISFADLTNELELWFTKQPLPKRDRRITFIFGTGVSLAVVDKDKRSKASWSGLLSELLWQMEEKDMKRVTHDGPQEDQWLRQTSMNHRLHMIRTLSHGDPDMAVATMYLIDRIYRQHPEPKLPVPTSAALKAPRPNHSYRWHDNVNAAMHDLEKDAITDPHWITFFRRLGEESRRGRVLPITTNFDHLISRASGLPIYLRPQSNSFEYSAINTEDSFPSWPDGLVIPYDKVEKDTPLTPQEINDLLKENLPAPVVFKRLWTNPGSFSPDFFKDAASIYHVHGSRLVSPSLVFDPISYDKICTANALQRLRQNPRQSGAIIFVGCKGTLLDPHFVQYWHQSPRPEPFIATLNIQPDADALRRDFRIFGCPEKPKFVSYGQDKSAHAELPGKLNELLDLLN